MKINTGLSDQQRRKLVDHLEIILADTYLVYLKTQNFHWNVTGLQFASLHLLFETQYQGLAEAVDEIAERIRALGYFAPASFQQFSTLASLTEQTASCSANEMIKILCEDNEALCRNLREMLGLVEDVKDDATMGLLGERLMAHEKNAWMLRSLLE